MSTDSGTSTLILVPAYNAAVTLPELLERIHAVDPDLPVLVVDDGSTDGTSQIGAAHANVVTVRHTVNRGKGEALKSGFGWALANGYAWVLSIDADLQHPPETIPAFMELAGMDRLVIGCRSRRGVGMPVDRQLSNFLTSIVASIMSGRTIPDSQCGMRLIPANLIRRLELKQGGFTLESELLLEASRAGCQIVPLPVPTVYGPAGSHIRHVTDSWRFVSLIFKQLWR